MKTYTEYILVTDWEKVDFDDFYLTSEDWAVNCNPDSLQQAKELQENDNLYIGYVVSAVHYAIYIQMDASQVFIDGDGNEIMSCEGAIIDNRHQSRFEYSY